VKRAIIASAIALGLTVSGVSAALAQYPPTSVPPPASPAHSTLPFTGASIAWGSVVVAALLITGLVLALARRRSRIPR